MTRLTGWWSGRSSAAKVELYTRWTFHAFAPLQITALGGIPISRAAESPVDIAEVLGMVLLVGVHAVLSAVLASRALDWGLDRRERPVRLATALTVLTAAACLTLLVLLRARVVEDGSTAASIVIGLVSFTLGTLSLCLPRVRHMLGAVLAAAFGTGAVVAALGIGLPEVFGFTVGILLGGAGLVGACGFSAWLLRTVWELERSRDLKARLAVAEERLRFGRDLHDVMGRNLSVIALKSELAVQLARRGRAENAVDQMTEVQRIAQESQREVRDVVRGYREADLRVELEGARGVLAAAGISCAMDPAGLELPGAVQSALGWVVREATTNVLRHGDARQCLISLREEGGSVLLVVENDGVREPAADADGTARRPGSGLAGLRERLSAVDGTLDAGPEKGGRFRLTARVPLTGVPEPEAGAEAEAAPEAGAVPAARNSMKETAS